MPEVADETTVAAEDVLVATLQRVWNEVSSSYDIIATLPEPATLFRDAPMHRPYEVAKTVLSNMLAEVIESVDRFSPWYTKPTQAFGLTTVLEKTTDQVHWCLTSEGVKRWSSQIEALSTVIRKDTSLIEAMIFVDELVTANVNDDLLLMAQCHCLPCRYIRVGKSILNRTEIICDVCHQAFFATGDFPDLDSYT